MKHVHVLSQVVCCLLSAFIAGAVSAEDKPAKEPPKLVIIKATYGDLANNQTSDVTEKVKGMVKPEGFSVAATNDNFGDPAEGTVKQLKVEYTLDGQKKEQTVSENETLTIEAKPAAAAAVKQGKLVIEKAFYGDLPNGPSTDVTEKVKAKVKDDALSVDANNDNFGDPAEGVEKKLKVDYSFDGVKKSKQVGEGETLKISDKGE